MRLIVRSADGPAGRQWAILHQSHAAHRQVPAHTEVRGIGAPAVIAAGDGDTESRQRHREVFKGQREVPDLHIAIEQNGNGFGGERPTIPGACGEAEFIGTVFQQCGVERAEDAADYSCRAGGQRAPCAAVVRKSGAELQCVVCQRGAADRAGDSEWRSDRIGIRGSENIEHGRRGEVGADMHRERSGGGSSCGIRGDSGEFPCAFHGGRGPGKFPRCGRYGSEANRCHGSRCACKEFHSRNGRAGGSGAGIHEQRDGVGGLEDIVQCRVQPCEARTRWCDGDVHRGTLRGGAAEVGGLRNERVGSLHRTCPDERGHACGVGRKW